jgi:hypothetical protein
VINIYAAIARPHEDGYIHFLWNANGFECSDFPRSWIPCDVR